MNSLTDLIDSIGGFVGQVRGNKSPSPVAANPAATGTATTKAWLPYALGGAALLLVIVLLARRS